MNNNNNNNITKSFKQTGFTNREYFQQQSPLLGNQFLEDTQLLNGLKRVLPIEVLNDIKGDLTNFGDRVVNDILELGRSSENNPPKLIQLDAWGRRIDKIVVDESWNQLKDIGCKEGLVSIGYERKYKEYSRVYQYIKVYLFACSSAVFDCPLSMTDGGARLLELYGTDSMKRDELKHYITRDPKQFWTNGQWMTEKTGGSDVSGSETIAQELSKSDVASYPQLLSSPPTHKVSGYKYFTSATTSDSSMILARDVDSNGNGAVDGSRGLSVYLIKLRKPNGELDNIRVHKLKNKFGTKAVPTAEIELMGTPAVRIGPKGRGVPVIASILNITRIHNVIHSVATMRRCVAIGRDFAHRRTVFGKLLKDNLLYLSTLAEMELEYRAGLHLLLDVSLLLGKSECCSTPEIDSLLRILTPLSKLYTAKQSIWASSEGIELLGGTGYMEDSDMPRLFRDTQVTSIWEGTTNVLSMDVWRSLKNAKTIECFFKSINDRLNSAGNQSSFSKTINSINESIKTIRSVIDQVMSGDMEYAESNARRFAYLLSQTYMASLLLEHAKWSNDPLDIQVCERWCFLKLEGGKDRNQSTAFINTDEKWREIDIKLALDLDESNNPRGTGDKCNITNKLRSRY